MWSFSKMCRLRVNCEKSPWYIPYYERKSNFWGTKIVNSNRIAFSDSAKDSGRHGRLLLLTCRSDQRRFSKKVSAEGRQEYFAVNTLYRDKVFSISQHFDTNTA